MGWNDGASKANKLAGFDLHCESERIERQKKTYSLAKDLTVCKEEDILTSAPQHRKNQFVSSVPIISNSGLVTTSITH
jgi:hypothetical protein